MEEYENKISEKQEDDNIYVYSDGYAEEGSADERDSEEDSTGGEELDTSGPNYSQAEKTHTVRRDEGRQSGSDRTSPFLLMLGVLSNPIEGWKSVRRSGINPDETLKGCFYPLLAFYALSRFSVFFYTSRVDFGQLFIDVLISIVSFFFGYFCILILLRTLMPAGVKDNITSNFGKVFIIISLSSLCMFFSFLEIMPMLWDLLIFLPLWTIYVVCRGARFFRFPEHKQISCTGILCFVIVGVPCLLMWGFEKYFK